MAKEQQLGRVSEIWNFPVKSMGGESVPEAWITPEGIPADRNWALHDEEAGAIASGKKIPKIMQLRARYLQPPADSFDGIATADIEITLPDGHRVRSDEPHASATLSSYLGRPVKLMPRYPADQKTRYRLAQASTTGEIRQALGVAPDEPDPDFSRFSLSTLKMLSEYATPPGTFYDVCPLHILTTATLTHIRLFYPEGDFRTERYRPSFLIETNPDLKGFVENNWQGGHLRAGDLLIDCDIPTIRCAMPGAAQHGIVADSQIPRTVARHAERNLGIYAAARASGHLRVGDAVYFTPPRFKKVYDFAKNIKRKVNRRLLTAMAAKSNNKAVKKGRMSDS